MSEPTSLQSEEYLRFADLIYNSAQLMREHGFTEQLVAVVGLSVETFGRSFIINDYGTINIYRAANIEPHTIHTITEEAFKRDQSDGVYELI